LIATACDSGYSVARTLVAAGMKVAAIVDRRANASAKAPAGVQVYLGSAVVAVKGRSGVRGATIAPIHGGTPVQIETDCIACAGGWTPAVHLHSMANGKLRWIEESSMFIPDQALPGVTSVGACAGVFALDDALAHAGAAGRGETVAAPVGGLGKVPADNLPSNDALASTHQAPGKIFIDLQNDVSACDVELAARENYRSVEHLKRYTTMGMATDQGKTSNINALVRMGVHTRRAPAEVGTTKFRPPFKPVTLNAIAAGRNGKRFRPIKHLAAEPWHKFQGAVLEEFGGWMRPAAYPLAGESLDAAAQREALHVRTQVGLFDASPLGKIEVFGPDAADFLDLMYVGTMSTLSVGQARYALMVDENGVIFDDGIVTRLGEQHFWVNASSGGAEKVVAAFEEWLQCEFVTHRVLVTPVTSNWGNVTVAGPKAWALLKAAGFEESLSPSQMKHMTMRELRHGGVPMRILRASFSGELGYEINLPASNTQALFEHLTRVGKPFQVAPYGIDALDLMRTEKGFIHLGADTDGTTFPADIGMDRGIAKKVANFVGRRSLVRPAAQDRDRMQLVGLVPVDRKTVPPVGAHMAASAPPSPIDGFVTSSCHSPALGHPVALAMVKGGSSRLGKKATVYHLGKPIAVELVASTFYDPQGERLHGTA
jgi:sarcosine oxidase subunit alpha